MPSVAHLSTAHSASDPRIFHKELLTLADAGYDVSYFVHHDRDEIRDGVQIKSLGTASSRTERWTHLIDIYRQSRHSDADLYHIHDPELLPVGICLKTWTDAKVVYDAHEDYGHVVQSRSWIPEVLRPLFQTAVPRTEVACAQHLDATVTATEWIADSLRQRGLPDTSVVHNFPKIANLKSESSRTSGNPALVYVGGLSDVRGIFDMLELIKYLRNEGRDVSLKLVGPFEDEEYRDLATTFVKENGLTEAIEFTGRVDYTDVFEHLDSAGIGLALLDTDHYEGGIPTKMFEYMYSELPVIITDIQATDRYFSPAWGVVVPENDTQTQATAICELLDDPERSKAMGAAGRAAVEASFCWEREERKLLELYDELL